ncbi:diacylglycerol kinase family protein [Candidatus Pacebacteria bacterium]|nr:diacylglycerol kinase family protein [Candidatus Paceibacterota bacterium]
MKRIYIVSNSASGVTENSRAFDESLAYLESTYDCTNLSIAEILDRESMNARITTDQPELIVAAGGDGTVNAAANIAVLHDITLAVLPTGTFNHFAKHMQIPREGSEAIKLIDAGHTSMFDVGEINGQYFVNFISLGIYRAIISRRVKYQKEGYAKLTAFFHAIMEVLFWYKKVTMHFETDSDNLVKEAQLVFIGNGTYTFGSSDILHERTLPQEGTIHLTFLSASNRITMLFRLIASFFTDIKKLPGITSLHLEKCTIRTQNERIGVVVDGEVLSFANPLEISVVPKALRVIVPQDLTQN